MGGKGRTGRNKFDRIYSESEHESSDDEEVMEISQKVNENENNNNSTENNNGSVEGNQGFQNEKFLVTRSKRRYDKPDIKINKNLDVSNKKDRSEPNILIEPPVKKKRETISSLDSKIQEATSFLEQLSKKLEDRENEIKDLKKGHYKK